MSRPGLAKRPATYDDLVKVPTPLVAEILEGDLYATPRPSAPHALAASALGGELLSPFQSGRQTGYGAGAEPAAGHHRDDEQDELLAIDRHHADERERLCRDRQDVADQHRSGDAFVRHQFS